jgi:putative endonuclease
VSTRRGACKEHADGDPAASRPPSRGAQAEQSAAHFLQQHGLTLLQRNYRCRSGEIDLVMQDGATLVFVEVRLRSRGDFGGAAASIDRRKQQHLIQAARHYLSNLPHTPPCRFDAVLLQEPDGNTGVEWLKNAFET